MDDTKTDLNQLVIFAKVVETRSFTAAGRALGLPKSTVSRKVAQLESRLGVRLLQRTTRKLSLTEVGAAFYERCARISTEISEAEQAVLQAQARPHGLLRVAAPPEFGTDFLGQGLSVFLNRYPEIDVQLELTPRRVDMIDEGFDIALQVGGSDDDSVIARELGPIAMRLVASPEYIELRGMPRDPADLPHHHWVVPGNWRRNGVLELVRADGERVQIDARPRLLVNNTAMAHRAVLAGVGISLVPALLCDRDIEAGRLKAFLPDWTHSDAAVFALYPTARHLAGKVRVLLDYFAEYFNPPSWAREGNGKDHSMEIGPQSQAAG